MLIISATCIKLGHVRYHLKEHRNRILLQKKLIHKNYSVKNEIQSCARCIFGKKGLRIKGNILSSTSF